MSPLVSKRMSALGVASAHAVSPSVSSPSFLGSTTAPLARGSRQGVACLIAQVCTEREREALANALSPLFPDQSPWMRVADVPAQHASCTLQQRLPGVLRAVAEAVEALRDSLTATAGKLSRWLDASEDDIRELALQFARHPLRGAHKVRWASHLLGRPIPGDDLNGQLARLADARFWRRAIRVTLMREREHFFLRLRLVGRQGEAYVSDLQLSTRLAQLKRQAQWMKETVLVPRFLLPGDAAAGAAGDGDREPLTLDKVASSPRMRFAKLYAFVKAMDAIAVEQGLSSGMLTLTLEPEWHPNPSHGQNSWNGASPRDAHRSMATRWQSVLRDLDRLGVGLSGLRVVEPHKDACPHWHLWLLYREDAQALILQTVMKYFPNKLKVRGAAGGDVVYETLQDLRARVGRRPTHPKEGSQVELACIDRSISSGASYAMKYLLKTVDGGEKLNEEVGVVGDQTHLATARRVDAYRSLWGINAGQLFGVAKCLTAWDELRRLNTAPSHPMLKRLWALARGSEQEGRMAGLGQRGDAKGFLEALGGLAACRGKKSHPRLELRRLVEAGTNGYGEALERTVGLELVVRRKVRAVVGQQMNPATGVITPRQGWRTVLDALASVRTRLSEWSLVHKDRAAEAVQWALQRGMAQLADEEAAYEKAEGAMPAGPALSQRWPSLAAALAGMGLLPGDALPLAPPLAPPPC